MIEVIKKYFFKKRLDKNKKICYNTNNPEREIYKKGRFN